MMSPTPLHMLGATGVLSLQRAVGNRAVTGLIRSQAAAALVQRHSAGHDPALAATGTSPRRQHFNRAIRHLQTSLDEVGLAKRELEEALTHGEEPSIRARLVWVEGILSDIDDAKLALSEGDFRDAKSGWTKVRTKLQTDSVIATYLVPQVEARLDETKRKRKDKLVERLVDFGLELQTKGDHLHAAVQYQRAHKIQPSDALALQIADGYRLGGDNERATPWYRKLLTSSTHGPKARLALRSMGSGETARFEALKAVDAHYTSVSKANLTGRGAAATSVEAMQKSGMYAEEQGTDFLGQNVFNYLLEMLTGTMAPSKLPALASFLRYNFGIREVNLRELFVQFARWQYQLSKGRTGWDTDAFVADVQRVYPDATKPELVSGTMDTWLAIKNAKVKYLKTSADREPYKLVKDGGVIKQGTPPKPVDGYDTGDESTNASGKGFAIYVMNSDGGVYAASHQVDRFHHSSFLAGADAAGAGEIKVEKGVIKEISNKSGHYQPGPKHLAQSIQGLSDLGPVSAATLRFHSEHGKILNWRGGPDDFVRSATDPVVFERRKTEEVAAQGGWKH